MPPLNTLPPEPVRAHLQKILASAGFAQSERLRRFLCFTVEQVIEGRAEQLKEYVIGMKVFDRKESYDPRIEPIVRVEARRLRAKLKRYYELEGRDEPIRIEFPKGQYAPVFRWRETEAASEAEPRRPAIAVLPFANRSPEPDAEYFSDGLTEELIRALTKVEGLRVVAWHSACQLKGKADDVTAAGRQLGVSVVLEGSVRRAGERLRVTAQLVSVADGAYLWSETYERPMRDVFAIQDEISQAIAATLRVRLGAGAAGGKRGTSNLDAYHLYLKGAHHWNRQTFEGLEKAVEYFGQAIACDPRFASAYAGLSDSLNLLVVWGAQPPSAVRAQATAAALQAVELDDSLAEAHASLGAARSILDWEWTAAEREFRRAIELNPRLASARHGYAMLSLAPAGRLAEAIEQMRLALELDPLSLFIHTSTATAFYYSRQYAHAAEQYRRALELDPHYHLAHWGLGRVCLQQGRIEEAIGAFETASRLTGGSPHALAGAGLAHALGGQPRQARKLLADLEARSLRGYVSPFHSGLIHLGLGQQDEALGSLEKAYAERDTPLAWLAVEPLYDPIRSDARFTDLMKKVAGN